jgi:photosynthetic reaction center cytochrome c subunit
MTTAETNRAVPGGRGPGARLRARLGRGAGLAAALGSLLLLGACDGWPVSSQNGYRGTGMDQISSTKRIAAQRAANVVPEAQPAPEPGGQKASEVYQNVQVLGDLSEGEFIRIMAAITEWVAPDNGEPNRGCAYCHNLENLADDSSYAKQVARRMIQMTRHVNTDWTAHVAQTGVTCYTCHRGNPVPRYTYHQDPGPRTAMGDAGNKRGQNTPVALVNLSSLPYDPLTPLLANPDEIRVIGKTELKPPPSVPRKTIQQTETTYGLMIHMSQSLGVNCTFCHNTRSFSSWATSTPQRVTAWHGLRMVADINKNYVIPLTPIIPAIHRGPLGDALKANCETCHQGASKPLLGVSMLKDYQNELGPRKAP